MNHIELKEIAVIGAGGFGREVRWLIDRINQVNPAWRFIGFYDDSFAPNHMENEWIIGSVSMLDEHDKPLSVVCAIASPIVRKRIVNQLSKNEFLIFPTLVDPSAILGDSCDVDNGCIICATSIITTDVIIGRHVHIDRNCNVGHNAVIGEFSTLYPSVVLSGNTSLGKCCEIGTNTSVLQGLTIANHTRIGAGAVVTKDIEEPNFTYVGVPARKLVPR